ncbi:MAG: restriction endonuclease subunit S [Lachnospiraceae bacterium]|nr:restriction endonuclease subunit S [Lachnospiraceae bacterium]MCH4062930.1 restriction endonuclease subunit S [Lachnospiraceae bacterium]MCH4104236.1 restriction endonuclease subunit S [Lachnospiraceae bacterium]MCI1309103.1 restriction endonuclease subunit S [Lachnospiraceae bacterium]MCI1356985.1 restriction endonuclease subunit S [Lachnospiraceae bacterium]
MGLTKHKIGTLITVINERNRYGYKTFYGINKNKIFMPTVADTTHLDAFKYKVVRFGRFVYSGMQTGRDKCIRISMYEGKDPIIVSPAYLTFEVTSNNVILPEYLFMIFQSPEKDRLGWFYSDGSVRANLDWSVFCNIELPLPDISTQRKYVDVYKAMVANQKAYEQGLDDMKLTCDAYMDRLKHCSTRCKIGELLKEVDCRNTDGLYRDVSGIDITKRFISSTAKLDGVNLKRYKVVLPGQFAYSSMQTGRDKCIRIALLQDQNPVIVSPAYSVLNVTDISKVLPEYIMLWFSRSEIDRLGWFESDGSVRASLDLSTFQDIEIPLPDMHIQKDIVSIYHCMNTRRNINERLKAQIKELCPILIRGSLQEGETSA